MMITKDGENFLNHDEIKQFVDMRYVGAHEAYWRLMGWELHRASHHIERLPVHLPDDQTVCYKPGDNIRKILEKAATKDSKLTAWFKLNASDPNAREYFYYEIPEHYTWVKSSCKWKLREGGKKTIGRMYAVSHNQGELFYLRMLLLNIKGAQSWQDLLKAENSPRLGDDAVVYSTFEDACEKRGLLANEE